MINQVTIWSTFHDDISPVPFHAGRSKHSRDIPLHFFCHHLLGTCPWHCNATVSHYCLLHAVGFCAAVGSQSLGIQNVGTQIWRTFSPQSLWDRTPTSIAKIGYYGKPHGLGYPYFRTSQIQNFDGLSSLDGQLINWMIYPIVRHSHIAHDFIDLSRAMAHVVRTPLEARRWRDELALDLYKIS